MKYLNICSPFYIRTAVGSIFLFVAIALFSTTATAQTTEAARQKADSLRTAINNSEGAEKLKAYRRYISNIQNQEEPEHVEQMYREYIKETQAQGEDSIAGATYYNYTVYLSPTCSGIEEFMEKTQEGFDFTKEHQLWSNYFNIYFVRINLCNAYGDVEAAYEMARGLYEEAKEVDYEEGIGLGAFWLGQFLSLKQQQEEAEAYSREALKKLKEAGSPQLGRAYENITDDLIYQGKYDFAKEVLDEWALFVEKGNAERVSYIRIFELEYGYLTLYSELKDFGKAEEHLNKMRACLPHLPEKSQGDFLTAEFLFYSTSEQAEKALETANKMIETYERDGLIKRVMWAHKLKYQILESLGRYEEALNVYKVYHDKKDSLSNLDVEMQLSELRTIYEVDKKNHEIEQQKAAIKMRNLWLLLAAILIVAVVALLVVRIRYARSLKAKNIGLVKQIQEQDRLWQKAQEERKELERMQQLLATTTGSPAVVAEERNELFERLERLMEEQQLYTNPELNRKSLAEVLGTNEKYLREEIRRHCNMTVNEYITCLRLRYAKNMLLLPAEKYTIEAIAIDSGFGSRSTFYSLFREQYGLAPDEFRKFASE